MYDHYGQDEKVGFILQCRAGTYHRIVEYGVLEVMPVACCRPGTASKR